LSICFLSPHSSVPHVFLVIEQYFFLERWNDANICQQRSLARHFSRWKLDFLPLHLSLLTTRKMCSIHISAHPQQDSMATYPWMASWQSPELISKIPNGGSLVDSIQARGKLHPGKHLSTEPQRQASSAPPSWAAPL
jgi:hypothetical protein